MNLTAVIATVLYPPTLEPLLEDCGRQGLAVQLVEGRKTNAAWRYGLACCETRYAIVLNDDLRMDPKGLWASRVMNHLEAGYTWVGCAKKAQVPTWAARRLPEEPIHKGHAFAVDLSAPVPPIPEDLEVMHGDDWIYWWHRAVGKACVCTDATFLTGADVGLPGVNSYSVDSEEIDAFFGESRYAVYRRDHKAARRYFLLPARVPDVPSARRVDFCGVPHGLRPEVLACSSTRC